MHDELPELDTPLALIKYTAPDLVEVRFKPGVRFTVDGLAAMMKGRQRLGASGKHRALMLLPEVIDFDSAVIRADHYWDHPQPKTEAVAWVAHNLGDAHIARVIINKAPPPFPWEVFLNEKEARDWLGSVVV